MTGILGLDRSRAAAWTAGRVLQVAVWDIVRFDEAHIRDSHRTIAEVLIRERAQ
jgi:streptomycin 6-kinase